MGSRRCRLNGLLNRVNRVNRVLLHGMVFVLIAAMLMAVTACTPGPTDATSPTSSASENSGPVKVVSTTDQWGSLAGSIGGSAVQVTSILDSTDITPSQFAPTSKDIAAIQQADIIVINGAGYDDWATDNVKQGTTIVSAAQTVGALDGDNPYLWFSKDARSSMAKELLETFTKALPGKRSTFNKNLKAWNAQEQRLEDHMDKVSSQLDGTRYASTYPLAFYLMADLGFSDVTPKSYATSITNDGQPDDESVKDFTTLIDGKHVDLLINDSQRTGSSSTDQTAANLVHDAELNDIPVLDVSEQMSDDAEDLTEWIDSMVSTVSQSVTGPTANGQTQPSGGASASTNN